METGTASEWAKWSVPECPFSIQYSTAVLEDIRLAVSDAFFSVPRGGLEIGGILLGDYSEKKLQITGFTPLPCEHAYGPSFTLSPRDRENLTNLIEAARTNPDSEPVGWYHSHTRSEVFLSDADLEIHAKFFPEPWQVALVLKPHTFQPTRAGFFFRSAAGAIHSEAAYQEITLAQPHAPHAAPMPSIRNQLLTRDSEPIPIRPLDPPPAPVAAPPPAPEPAEPPPPAEAAVAQAPVAEAPAESPVPAPAAAPVLVSATAPDPVAPPTQPAPAPPIEAASVPPPSFLSAVQPAESKIGKWIGWIVLLLLIAAVGGGAYITRAVWLPLIQASVSRSQSAATPSTDAAASTPEKVPSTAAPPPLDLSAMEREGQIEIRWNQQAAAILEATRGRLTIEDGGPPLSLDLDASTLHTGAFTYKRKTERVDIGFTVFRSQLPAISEKRTFLGTLPGEFDSKSTAADPAAGADKATRDEIDQLRSALGRQVARNRDLENTVKQLRKQLDQQRPAR